MQRRRIWLDYDAEHDFAYIHLIRGGVKPRVVEQTRKLLQEDLAARGTPPPKHTYFAIVNDFDPDPNQWHKIIGIGIIPASLALGRKVLAGMGGSDGPAPIR